VCDWKNPGLRGRGLWESSSSQSMERKIPPI
jgi:hypothetical protein